MALSRPDSMTKTRLRPVHYPDSDGKPMAETDVHRSEMFALIGALQWRYRDDPMVYVSGNLLLYYEEGNPRRCVAPDVFVVKGVPKGDRRTYLLWAEGAAPCAVIELTSRSTRREDVQTKHALYARLGVREYFLFDPMQEYLRPRLQGFRLVGDDYESITPAADGTLQSMELGLTLTGAGLRLRLRDATTGADVMDDAGRAAADRRRAEAERSRAEAAESRLADAEARAAAAEAELERLRGQ